MPCRPGDHGQRDHPGPVDTGWPADKLREQLRLGVSRRPPGPAAGHPNHRQLAVLPGQRMDHRAGDRRRRQLSRSGAGRPFSPIAGLALGRAESTICLRRVGAGCLRTAADVPAANRRRLDVAEALAPRYRVGECDRLQAARLPSIEAVPQTLLVERPQSDPGVPRAQKRRTPATSATCTAH